MAVNQRCFKEKEQKRTKISVQYCVSKTKKSVTTQSN